MSDKTESRRFRRVPVGMEVQYRSRGSFLVSYSINLSKGGIFIESTAPLSVGTTVSIRFAVPGTDQTIESEARVMWVREENNPDHLPPGMGIQFEQSIEDQIGHLIDELIRDFGGVTLLAIAAASQSQDQLARYLRNILNCEVDVGSLQALEQGNFPAPPDLVVVDINSTGDQGIAAIENYMQAAAPVPVVAIVGDDDSAALVRGIGVTVLVGNPPAFDTLRNTILGALGKPLLA